MSDLITMQCRCGRMFVAANELAWPICGDCLRALAGAPVASVRPSAPYTPRAEFGLAPPRHPNCRSTIVQKTIPPRRPIVAAIAILLWLGAVVLTFTLAML